MTPLRVNYTICKETFKGTLIHWGIDYLEDDLPALYTIGIIIPDEGGNLKAVQANHIEVLTPVDAVRKHNPTKIDGDDIMSTFTIQGVDISEENKIVFKILLNEFIVNVLAGDSTMHFEHKDDNMYDYVFCDEESF